MGACASVPRAMRGEFTAAPAPEPAKEETPAAVEKAEEAAVTEKKNEEKADSTADQTQSLGTLLVESEAAKEEAESSESKVEKIESKVAEVLPVSQPAAPVTSEVVAAPVKSEDPITSKPAAEVVAKVEEKKTEVAEKK